MIRQFHIAIITPEDFTKNEIGFIMKLFGAGLKTLHLRKPGTTKKELKNFLQEIPPEFHRYIVIHSHYSLIKEFKLKGAHLPEQARNSVKTIEFLKKNKVKIISTSFHSVNELNRNRRKYEYTFLSPVFDSLSKTGYKSSFNLNELKPVLSKHKNVIALGGVSVKNILSVKKTGFFGAAVLGHIWDGKNPVDNYKKLALKIK